MISLYLLLASSAIATSVVFAQSTPWALGEEEVFQCYTLTSKQDIPTPPGLSMSWVTPPPRNVDEATDINVEWKIEIDPTVFYSSPMVQSLLGSQLNFYRNECHLPQPSESCTKQHSSECCIFHANIHSCRQDNSSNYCLPWIGPKNGTESNVLVTHTPAQVGVLGTYRSRFRLPHGAWFIVGHFKVMTFQCAVGASRLIQEQQAVMMRRKLRPWEAALIAVVCAVAVGLLAAVAVLLRQKFRDPAKFAPKDADKPVAVLFTAVKNASALWGAFPSTMPQCIDLYSNIVRGAVDSAQCYEAQRLGDFYLIAACDMDLALACASKIQKDLAQVDWKAQLTTIAAADANTEDVDAENISARYSHHDYCSDTESLRSDAQSELGNAKQRQRKREPDADLLVAIGIDFGTLRIDYDEKRRLYSYHGKPIDTAALVADLALPRQVLLSRAAANGVHPTSKFAEDLERYSRPAQPPLGGETDSDNEDDAHAKQSENVFYELHVEGIDVVKPAVEPEHAEPKNSRHSNNNTRKSKQQRQNGPEAVVDSVVAEADRSRGLLTRKKVTVAWLELDLGPDDLTGLDKEKATSTYGALVRVVNQVATSHRGHVQSFAASVVVLSFNAAQANSDQGPNALRSVVELQQALPNVVKGSSLRGCGIATGTAYAGVNGNVSVLSGPLVQDAKYLAQVAAESLPPSCAILTFHNNLDIHNVAPYQWVAVQEPQAQSKTPYRPRRWQADAESLVLSQSRGTKSKMLLPHLQTRGIAAITPPPNICHHTDEEWMYTVDRSRKMINHRANRAFYQLIAHQRFDFAEKCLAEPWAQHALEETPCPETTPLTVAIKVLAQYVRRNVERKGSSMNFHQPCVEGQVATTCALSEDDDDDDDENGFCGNSLSEAATVGHRRDSTTDVSDGSGLGLPLHTVE